MKQKKVGVIGPHGIAREILFHSNCKHIKLQQIDPPKNSALQILVAPTAYKQIQHCEVDLILAPIFPILTELPWIYTPADSHTFMSFKLFGLPTPRILKTHIVKKIFERKNLIALAFKSEAGLKSLDIYPSLISKKIAEKSTVLYPPIRRVSDDKIRFNKKQINILFSGFFLRKGGIHVVEAFEKLQEEFDNIKLWICSKNNFMTKNKKLERKWKERIKKNPNIIFGYQDREKIMNHILPQTDIFVCPTYKDTYGYAIQEAMAYGIPVIATNYFAIPEIVEDGKSGFLIKIKDDPYIKNLKGYEINYIPSQFHKYMTNETLKYLRLLIKDYSLRREMGLKGLEIARKKFSFENWCKKIDKLINKSDKF